MFVKKVALSFKNKYQTTIDKARECDLDKFDQEIIGTEIMDMQEVAILIGLLDDQAIEINDQGTDLLYLKSVYETPESDEHDMLMGIYFILKNNIKRG